MSFFGSSSNDPSNPQEVKAALMQQVQSQAAVTNARALISRVNSHCFDACIPKPGSSLSSNESTCLSNCMEKYISMWNVVNRTYVNRLGKESKAMGQDSAMALQLSTPASSEGNA